MKLFLSFRNKKPLQGPKITESDEEEAKEERAFIDVL